MAKTVHLFIDLILKPGGWRTLKSYAKHYDKPIEENKFVEAIFYNLEMLKL